MTEKNPKHHTDYEKMLLGQIAQYEMIVAAITQQRNRAEYVAQQFKAQADATNALLLTLARDETWRTRDNSLYYKIMKHADMIIKNHPPEEISHAENSIQKEPA